MIADEDMKVAADLLCEADEYLLVAIKRTKDGNYSFSHLISNELLQPIFSIYIDDTTMVFRNEKDS